MASRPFFVDIRTRLREAFAAWAVLTTSALVLTLIATLLAYWMGRGDIPILFGFVVIAPIAGRALWLILDTPLIVGTTKVSMPSEQNQRLNWPVSTPGDPTYRKEKDHAVGQP